MNEEERVKGRPYALVSVLAALNTDRYIAAAVAMTLCELATAKHNPPLECTALRSAGGDTPEGASAAVCVE